MKKKKKKIDYYTFIHKQIECAHAVRLLGRSCVRIHIHIRTGNTRIQREYNNNAKQWRICYYFFHFSYKYLTAAIRGAITIFEPVESLI